jgi:hypothetical protein
MSKMREDEVERRIANNARIIDEYMPTLNLSWCARPAQSEAVDQDEYYIPPEDLAAVRAFVAEAVRESEERFSREQVLVFDLVEQRGMDGSVVWGVSDIYHLVLRDAVERFGWEALHLDDIYAGLTHKNGHFLVSERMTSYCLRNYAPEDFLVGARNEKARIMDEAWAGIPRS